ncbi:hypothetical protein STRTUCAR8_09803 [Streptomyces turgidiscabies Car8]|uniref:Uncharacterized protein n=1 Tax=Streptomyces turgidiscabies (strain Car8) TaxID=698760 RepID=L7EWC5_STRT8|nr:hypothetical protein STRTUCAR8_09803 [Streptomyces turgidiscabies Car8]
MDFSRPPLPAGHEESAVVAPRHPRHPPVGSVGIHGSGMPPPAVRPDFAD